MPAWTAPPHPTTGDRYLAPPEVLARKLGTDPDAGELLDVLGRASDRFRGAVRHPVHLITEDTVTVNGPGRGPLVLPAAPVHGSVRIAVRTTSGAITHTTITDELVPAGYGIDRAAGMIERPGGWPTGLGAITITYSHGHAQIPGDIQDAVLEVAETEYTLEHGLASMATGNESAAFSLAEATGVTQRWSDAVANHQLNHGDRQ